MQSSSPYPITPPQCRSTDRGLQYLPQFSSPLADAQARRRSQYKSRTPRRSSSSGVNPLPGLVPGLTRRSVSAEAPQKTFLRERFQAHCAERAQRKRRRRMCPGPRWGGSEGSSDGPDDEMDYEDEEDDDKDEAVLQDELFRRIMENAKRKKRHAYRLSYARDVGSSVDPDMEDIGRWENELKESEASYQSCPLELTPDVLENEELAEYAALADFADLDALPDELFDWSDGEEGHASSGSRMQSQGIHNIQSMDDVNMSG